MGLFPTKDFTFKDVWWTSLVQIISKIKQEKYPWEDEKSMLVNDELKNVKSVGILLKVGDDIYCITTANCIRNAEVIKLYVEEAHKNAKTKKRLRQFTCVIDTLIIDLNLCILKCDNADFNNWSLYDHVANFDIISSEHILVDDETLIMNVDYQLLKKLDIKKTTTHTTINNICFDNVYHHEFCKLPYYTITIENADNINYLGCPCINTTGHLIGLINSFVKNNDEITCDIVPSVVLMRVINERFTFDTYKGLSVVKLELNKKKIINFYNLKYQTNTNKNFSFIDNDVILSINRRIVTHEGLVYDTSMKMCVSIEAYIALNIYTDQFLRIEILRNEKIIIKNIKPKKLIETFSLGYSYNWDVEYDLINFYGLYFVTPTIELLNRLYFDGFFGELNYESIKNDYTKTSSTKKSTSEELKYNFPSKQSVFSKSKKDIYHKFSKLLLVSIDETESTGTICKMFNHDIICNIKNRYFTLTSINKKKINNMDELKQFMDNNEKCKKINIMLEHVKITFALDV